MQCQKQCQKQLEKALTATSLLSLIWLGGKAAQAQQTLSNEEITASATRNNISLITSEASCQRLPEQQAAFDEALATAEPITPVIPVIPGDLTIEEVTLDGVIVDGVTFDGITLNDAPLFDSAALLEPLCSVGGGGEFPDLHNPSLPPLDAVEAELNRGPSIRFFSPCGGQSYDRLNLICIEFG